ncbi:MAG: hypothetical protein IJY39_13240 [Clostridia bacterium]|nr:hypothetical protein [Clostridia bacterium]
MNIEEKIEYLRKCHPAFGRKVLYDVDSRGNEFCELIYPNEKQPMMPIALSVSDEGCLISVGQISNVTGDRPITPEQAANAIDDIIHDKIVFVLGFAEEDDIGSGAPFMTEIFALTDREDDMRAEFERFIAKISTPVTGWKRKLTKLKGRFTITNFSGSLDRVIIR